MRLTVKRCGINGEGIAFDYKVPVFLPGALANEEVEAEIINTFKGYKQGKVQRIIKRSKERVEPVCKNTGLCDSCPLMITTYQNQLQIKKELLAEALNKYAGITRDFEIVENDHPFAYRNCLKLPVGTDRNAELVCGMYRSGSNRFVKIDHCIIHDERMESIRKQVLEVLNRYHFKAYDPASRKGIRGIYLRTLDQKTQLCIVSGEDRIPAEVIEQLGKIDGLVSLWQSIDTRKNSADFFGKQMIHLGKEKQLQFSLSSLKLNLSVRSFFQLNTCQAEKLYSLVKEKVPEGCNTLVEAYCGIGAMSLLCASKVKKVVGIEIIEDAIINAKKNAQLNSIRNAEFYVGDSAQVIRERFRHETIDCLIVDPPRSGLDEEMIDTLLKAKIRKIIYVSCNPASLSKNLFLLTKRYNIKDVTALDMFSYTPHVESIVTLEHKNGR